MIDPKLEYCTTCKCSWRPGLLHKLIMLITGEYIYTCPQCQTRMQYKLIHHVVKTKTEPVKDKSRLWRRG